MNGIVCVGFVIFMMVMVMMVMCASNEEISVHFHSFMFHVVHLQSVICMTFSKWRERILNLCHILFIFYRFHKKFVPGGTYIRRYPRYIRRSRVNSRPTSEIQNGNNAM